MTRQQLLNMRLRYGYTLRQVADKAGVSHMEIQYIERGERTLTPEIERKIVTALYQLNMDAARKRHRKVKKGAAKVEESESD